MKEIQIKNQLETENFGLALADKLVPGSVVALTGDLGAGKTTLTKAIAKGLGIQSMVTSPTFLIIQEYKDGRLPLYHFDLYRINDEDEMDELGYEEYFYGDGVCVLEWADRIKGLLPENTLWIHIKYGNEENERIYKIDKYTGN
ncbi:MAG: tRNA (adenosine(37)-N6)-threonylcarbamoyltransferase complex ATPase subunit type 1 TsaE [Eubacteriales bacterium]|nr:tRNA (adenosine(37)-N6)-threonylcarbamoyltransferase complex ATPase subunit type 1 TsaE [Eubacteriales bacterium]